MVAHITQGTAFDKHGRPFRRRNYVPGLAVLAVLAVVALVAWVIAFNQPADVPEATPLPGATKAFAAAADAVQAAVDSGALVAPDPLLLSLTLWSGVHGVATVLQLGFGLPPELEDAMIDDVTDRILAGYRPGAPTA